MEDPRFPLVSPAMALAANGSSPRVRSGSWSGEPRTKPHPILSEVSSLICLTAGRRRRDGGGNPLQRVRSRSCHWRWCKLVQDLPRLSRASRKGLCVLRARSQQLGGLLAACRQSRGVPRASSPAQHNGLPLFSWSRAAVPELSGLQEMLCSRPTRGTFPHRLLIFLVTRQRPQSRRGEGWRRFDTFHKET